LVISTFCKEFAGAVFTKSGHLQGLFEAVFERASELFNCLDRVDDVTQIEKFSKLVEVEVGHLHCIIAQSTQKRRRQVENVTSVNVVVEMRSNNPKQIKGTRHIDHYRGSK
jgi:hypothetical protein